MLDVDIARVAITNFWREVCPALRGSAECERVTQGRWKWKCGGHPYSSCADLAMYGLERLGLKSKHINRDDPTTDENEWRQGLNVSLLAHWKNVVQEAPHDLSGVLPGDILIRWSDKSQLQDPKRYTLDAHVVCVLEARPLSHVIETAEYGQVGEYVGIRAQRARLTSGRERPWQKWLSLGRVIRACEEEAGDAT